MWSGPLALFFKQLAGVRLIPLGRERSKSDETARQIIDGRDSLLSVRVEGQVSQGVRRHAVDVSAKRSKVRALAP